MKLDPNTNIITIPGYELVRNDRTSSGGVAILIR
jgi:hypothetical protein